MRSRPNKSISKPVAPKRRIKLSYEKASAIRKLHFKQDKTITSLAKKYHVAVPTVTHVLYNLTWTKY